MAQRNGEPFEIGLQPLAANFVPLAVRKLSLDHVGAKVFLIQERRRDGPESVTSHLALVAQTVKSEE